MARSATARSGLAARGRPAGDAAAWLALLLPEEWREDLIARRKAKIPDVVAFETKPQLVAGLVERAASWEIPAAPILADCAYGDNSEFRSRLYLLELEYVVAVSSQLAVFDAETRFAVPERAGATGRREP